VFGPKVRLPKALFERCKQCAATAGYRSVEEFVIHTLEKEIRKAGQSVPSGDKDLLAERLRGLGYLK